VLTRDRFSAEACLKLAGAPASAPIYLAEARS
jgi:hypothetical protein